MAVFMSFFLDLLSCGFTPPTPPTTSLPAPWAERGLHLSSRQRQALQAETTGQLEPAFRLYQNALLADDPSTPALRQRAIAVSIALGQIPQTLKLYRQQASENLPYHLTVASLLLQDQRPLEAAREIRFAMGVIMNRHQVNQKTQALQEQPDSGSPEQTLSRFLKRGHHYLHEGNYTQAQQMYDRALRLTDTLLTAHSLWFIAEHDPLLTEPIQEALIQWANLGDQLLHCLAKTTLAENLADVLRQRHLRADLASWATGSDEITHLLTLERDRLTVLAHSHPNHAEMHYRLGMLARALDDFPAAIKAFRQVLKIQPHHAATSVRLAATLLQQNQTRPARRVLEQMHTLPPATLRQYHALALAAATDAPRFEKTIAHLEQQPQHRHSDLRANLTFVLTAMGAKDLAPVETGNAISAVP